MCNYYYYYYYFCTTVSSSQILTAEEALDILLQRKGSTPRKKLAFSDELRVGAWTEHLFTSAWYHSYQQIRSPVEQAMNFEITDGNIRVDKIYFINSMEADIDVCFTNWGNVRTLRRYLTRVSSSMMSWFGKIK